MKQEEHNLFFDCRHVIDRNLGQWLFRLVLLKDVPWFARLLCTSAIRQSLEMVINGLYMKYEEITMCFCKIELMIRVRRRQ